jgi:N-acetylmuramoyl-L-alanine amidase
VAYGQARTADVLYTYFDDAPVHGYRVGDECFVPTDQLTHFGWTVDLRADQAEIKAEGTEFSMGVRMVGGKTTLPLRAALTKLGCTADWIVNTDTLQVLSELTSVKYESGKIRVVAPMFIKPHPFVLTGPDRVVIDYLGAKIGTKTVQTLEGGVRISQYKPNVVRMVIQTQSLPDISKVAGDPTKTLELELAEASAEAIPAKTTQSDGVPATGIPLGDEVHPTLAFLPLEVEHDDDHSALLAMKLTGLKGQAQFRKPDPETLEIVLPGVFLDLAPDFKLGTDIVSLARAERTPTGTLVTLNLARPVGAEVSTTGQNVSVQLLKPNVGDGRLVGKIIVVDPGHGGADGGAKDGGVHEKDLTLPIGKLVASKLAIAGATVIMTRKTDVFIPLTSRADIANNSKADFFVSCHINDSGGSRSMAGTITFHHKGNEISRVLAECIQHEIAKVSGLNNVGVWSDGKIYPQSGFSVLRNTKMPGVLIEFGFIDNAGDRKRMLTDQFQDAVAAAVVQGIKVYLGDAKTK